MKARAATTVALGFGFVSTLAFPSTAAADDIGWNPFLSRPICSTCAPLTPLTLEQADTVEVLLTDFLDTPVVPPVIADEPGPAIGAGGPPTPLAGGLRPTVPGGQIPNFLGPTAGAGGSGGSAPQGGVGVGGGNGGGLPYGLTVTDAPGSNDGGTNNGGNGSSGSQNDVTFSFGDQPGPLNLSEGLVDGPGGQAGETLVPEPTTLLLLGSGLSAAAVRRRRQRMPEA